MFSCDQNKKEGNHRPQDLESPRRGTPKHVCEEFIEVERPTLTVAVTVPRAEVPAE